MKPNAKRAASESAVAARDATAEGSAGREISGTGWYNDPAEDMTTILMIQQAPAPPSLPILHDFWTAAYQAIDD
jgi:hypothetical protein